MGIGTDEQRLLSKAHATPRGRSKVVVLASAVVLIILLLSSAAPVVVVAAEGSDTSSETNSTGKGNSSTKSSSQKHVWDWESLADDDGYVDVIVSWSDHAKSSNSHSAKANDMMVKFNHGMKSHFSKAYDGFVSHVSLEVVNEYLESGDSSIQIHPDMTVNATLTDNIIGVGADQAWSRLDLTGMPVDGQGVIVAVIDTGVDYTHPDLGGGFGIGYKVIGGYDFYNDDSDPMDDNGHGTHVAGIIAADGVMTGVAPGASILAYKALGADGSGSVSDIILAIDAAIDDHAQVISMSLGGKGESDDPACVAVENAIAAGIVVVVAAGNDGPSVGTVASPGLAPDAITVGAVDNEGVLADFSSRGTSPSLSIKPEISAPGVHINSTVPFANAARASPTGYAVMSGTSMATPHVSGGAALLLQMHPAWTPAEVKSALVSGSAKLNESIWSAGAGAMWIPSSLDSTVFFEPALVSYGLAGAAQSSVSITNQGMGATLFLGSIDYCGLSADGSAIARSWTNVSGVSPDTAWISYGGMVSAAIDVSTPSLQAPEGYYDGEVRVTDGTISTRIPFGFAVLSRVNIHVLNMDGAEVFDPYGGVWVYDDPEADVAVGVRGSLDRPAPPASFLLPSGEYSAHSFGHQLLYEFDDPYALSAHFTLGRLETKNVYMNMTSAHEFTLDLETDEGLPIFVKDYRVYGRHEGTNNISFHLVGSDYSVEGSEIFSLPKSKSIYVSDTDIRIGIAVSGFSYTSAMWDFMYRNWQHWYEYSVSSSTVFYQESSSDLQYLMAWEFDGIDSWTNTVLTLVPGLYSVYDIKYDIPGAIDDIWGDWGKHRSMGGDSAFYIRRDTDTSLNAFFSGMTRRTIVQGVFTETYFPGDLFQGYFEKQYYSSDYSALVRANLAAEVYLPDRNFLTSIDGVTSSERMGSGPFYPSVRTENTADSMVMYQPLLRDQSGAKVGGMLMPSMTLYVGGQLAGVYQIAEYLARPDAKRIVPLSEPGVYTADLDYTPVPQICGDVDIELGFSVPAPDMDPPQITGLSMSERFVPGDRVPITVSARDVLSSVTVTMSWRSGSGSAWSSVPVTSQGDSSYGAYIQTTSATTTIDIMITVTDASGNYIKYTASDAAEPQIPVTFSLSTSTVDIGYRNGDVTVVLTGTLTDSLGNPLHPTAGIPIELIVDGRKVAMILDEYIADGSHSHNGNIRFEWHFNPIYIFTGPDQTVSIVATFDLGIYQPVQSIITLHSTYYYNPAPVISLVSPEDGSIIPAGQLIDFEVSDDGAVQAQIRVDGTAPVGLQAPWNVNTTGWAAEDHVIEVTATDDQLVSTVVVFSFHVDTTYPSVTIVKPEFGSSVPINWTLNASVSDDHLDLVTYTLDGGIPQPLSSPYSLSMVGWPVGSHTVTVEAVDLAGHHASNTTSFTIAVSSVVISVTSPENGDVVHSGVPIVFSVLSLAAYTSSWSESGLTHALGSATTISTAGWGEGMHAITINSTDSLGSWDELTFNVTIDDTAPVITLLPPLGNQTFVSPTDVLSIRVDDTNYKSTTWSIWSTTLSSTNAAITIPLTHNPGDGPFFVILSAIDRAGNMGNDTFVFSLDSSPPSIVVVDIESMQAVLPDQVISVNVSDKFLANVSIAVDSGAAVPFLEPYQIDCSELALGWCLIQIWAYDYSGKYSLYNLTLFVDGYAPVVSTEFPSTANSTASLVLHAYITDDFAVSRAELFYQVVGGGFLSVLLQGDGSYFSAAIPAGCLWDGMYAYVVAYDFAGHSTMSDQVTLNITLDAGENPATPSDGLLGQLLSGSYLFVLLALAVVCGLIVLYLGFFGGRRNKHEDRKTRTPVDNAKAPGFTSSGPRTRVVHDPTVLAWSTLDPGIVTKRQETAAVAKLDEPPARPTPPIEPEPIRRPSLIDSIPDVMLSSPDQKPEEGSDEVDYGDLILKELVVPSLRNSVYSKEPDNVFDQVDERLNELEVMFSKDNKKLLGK